MAGRVFRSAVSTQNLLKIESDPVMRRSATGHRDRRKAIELETQFLPFLPREE